NGIRLATHLAFLRVVLGNLTGQVIPRHRAIHLVQELLTACLLALTGKFRFRKTQLAHDEQTREGVTDEVYRWAGELFRASLMASVDIVYHVVNNNTNINGHRLARCNPYKVRQT